MIPGMAPEPPPLPPLIPNGPRHPWLVWLGGGLAANAIIAGVYAGVVALAKTVNEQGDFGRLVGLPSFFLVPVLAGFLAAYLWRRLEPTAGAVAVHTLWMTLVALGGAAVLFREGAVCLLIVSPLFYGLVLAGALLGRVAFKSHRGRLYVSVLPLLAVAVAGEPFLRTDREGVVVDTLLIRAPPARVWPEVTAFPDIPAEPQFWLFRLGLPYPVATTTAGNFVGADRKCIFSGGAVFQEEVTECVPGERLTFDIVGLPPDPELLGHLTLRRGQFLLRDNGNGTTTLTGSSWYALHVRPLGYFDVWTHHIFRAVHLRVMEDVRRRAEAAAAPAR